jgi:transitional endoplasmic reticulum ATPase
VEFAAAGFATYELDTKDDPIIRWRGFIPAAKRGQVGSLADAIYFAKYHYKWKNEDFILYTCQISPYMKLQYVLKEPVHDDTLLGHSKATDALITAIGQWLGSDQEVVYVFDGVWSKSKSLWNEVQKAKWENVILDPDMKKELVDVANKFFDSTISITLLI